MKQNLSPRLEMYLKAIYQQASAQGAPAESVEVPMKEIARALEVTVPSVSEAIGTLKGRGLVLHEAYGGVRLTSRGARLGREINDRFDILQRFLVEVLDVSPPIAGLEACEIEHVLGQDTLQRLGAYLSFLEHGRADAAPFLEHFHQYLHGHLRGEPCARCEQTTDLVEAPAVRREDPAED